MFFSVLNFLIFLKMASGQEKDPRCPLYNEGVVVHLPHEYDCTKFYKCDWGIPKLFACELGLHFSVLTDRCEYPSDANCQLQGTSTQRTTTTLSQSTSTFSQSTTPYPIGSRCPSDDDPFNNPIFLPHEYDCSLFYMCFFGDLMLYECSIPGTHWSVHLNKCEDPSVADCQLGQKPSTTLSYRDPRCPLVEDPLNPVHLPHEYDCTLFYRCDNGILLLHRCPGGIHWSVVFDRCEWPEIAGCDLNSTSPPTTTTARTTPTTTTARTTPTTTTARTTKTTTTARTTPTTTTSASTPTITTTTRTTTTPSTTTQVPETPETAPPITPSTIIPSTN